MKFKVTCAALAAALATLAAGTASAQEAEVAFNAAVTTDYVFRGFSQTDEGPAFQAGVDLGVSGFYAGAWASNVDFGDDTDAEVDIYGGYRTEVAGFGLDVAVLGYLYVNEPSGADYNFVEYKAALSRSTGPLSVGAVVYYSSDFFGADDEAVYVEANLAYATEGAWSFSGAVGHQSLDVSDDYVTWNAGATYAFTDAYAFDVRYHDTDVANSDLAEARIVASLKAAF